MQHIELPISKSIANRLLILQAKHGDPLMEVSCDMPDDVRLLHDVLASPIHRDIHLSNCGTAMRFLTAYYAQLDGCEVVLDGDERMRQRPIGQLVDALRECGAQIDYIGERGYPPLHIVGRKLVVQPVTISRPLSTQFISALLLIGVPVQTDITSPYIEMTKSLLATYPRFYCSVLNRDLPALIERDWSAAAFWYEYVALHGGEIFLPGLHRQSLQGDKVVADIFRSLGVTTTYADGGISIARKGRVDKLPLRVNFRSCPDLYPAVAITCRCLHKPLWATGTASLRIKESDRLRAVREQRTYHDHRIAMALLAADLPCDDTACIAKSYPAFLSQLSTLHSPLSTINYQLIIPRRGINDEGLGKKHALYRLISAATSDYVWLMDDDITPPIASLPTSLSTLRVPPADFYILPLRMQGGRRLIERLQIAEYAAIQEVTMRTAKRGKAVMCSGANMIVHRERWLESYEDLHPEIASGDDMFLLESFRRRGLRIVALDAPDYTATVQALPTLRALLRQRMRWAGKAAKYQDVYIIRYGATILIANLLQLLCPPVILIKFPFEYSLIKKRDPQASFFVALLLELLYPVYLLFCLLGGLLSSRSSRHW